MTRGDAKWYYRVWLEDSVAGQATAIAARDELRGKNLACWCHIWQCPKCERFCDIWTHERAPKCTYDHHAATVMLRVPCHCDILLKYAQQT